MFFRSQLTTRGRCGTRQTSAQRRQQHGVLELRLRRARAPWQHRQPGRRRRRRPLWCGADIASTPQRDASDADHVAEGSRELCVQGLHGTWRLGWFGRCLKVYSDIRWYKSYIRLGIYKDYPWRPLDDLYIIFIKITIIQRLYKIMSNPVGWPPFFMTWDGWFFFAKFPLRIGFCEGFPSGAEARGCAEDQIRSRQRQPKLWWFGVLKFFSWLIIINLG